MIRYKRNWYDGKEKILRVCLIRYSVIMRIYSLPGRRGCPICRAVGRIPDRPVGRVDCLESQSMPWLTKQCQSKPEK